jgi:DNA-binding NarL/FixJ family response regulator
MFLFQSTEIGRMKMKPFASNGTAGKPKRTVLIIDDHIIVRQGLKQLINREEDLLACGEVEDARKGLEAIRVLKPEVVLVDISLPGMNGIEFIKNAKASYPDLRVVVYSMHDESLYAERVLRAGAFGYVMKRAESEEILTALRKALRGEIHTSGTMEGTLMQRFLGKKQAKNGSLISSLSDRELEIFELIGHGKTRREIVGALNLSIKTVDTHRMHAKEKLGLHSAMELVQHAVHHVETGPAG